MYIPKKKEKKKKKRRGKLQKINHDREVQDGCSEIFTMRVYLAFEDFNSQFSLSIRDAVRHDNVLR